MPADQLTSGRGQPFQEKAETAEYRVLYSPQVVVRDRPWGRVIGARKVGESVRTTHRSIGLPEGVWVKTADGASGRSEVASDCGWMLVDGRAINLPMLLEKVEAKGRKGMVCRYRVIGETCDIRERPSLAGTPVVGARNKGALLRTDQEVNGFVRLQHDFYAAGSAEPIEGWALLHGQSFGIARPTLQRWEPATSSASATSSVSIGSTGAQGGQTSRYWVAAAEGVPVRERPWGRVLCTKSRGQLLRCDCERDGWVRLEADFSEEGPLDHVDGEGEEASNLLEGLTSLLEGWVLIDGRDLGLPRQLVRREKEKVPPPEEPRLSEAEVAERRRVKRESYAKRGEGERYSLSAMFVEAKVSDDVAAQLSAAGVTDFEQLITIISRGDHHEELRRCGVTKLGARAKLATMVQPYWKALALKEQGNAMYKSSRFEDAAALYGRAIEEIANTFPAADLLLNCHSNRAACLQQMREPALALADVDHVLTYDPANAKALARKNVYELAVAGGL